MVEQRMCQIYTWNVGTKNGRSVCRVTDQQRYQHMTARECTVPCYLAHYFYCIGLFSKEPKVSETTSLKNGLLRLSSSLKIHFQYNRILDNLSENKLL